MINRVFIDSNLWIYLFTKDNGGKYKTAKDYIAMSAENSRLVISYQVVNEVCYVLKKKNYTEPEIQSVAKNILGLCEVCGYSNDIIFLASELRERYSFSYWDSHVAASALTSQCNVLASEDMQDGLKINTMIIKNVLKVR